MPQVYSAVSCCIQHCSYSSVVLNLPNIAPLNRVPHALVTPHSIKLSCCCFITAAFCYGSELWCKYPICRISDMPPETHRLRTTAALAFSVSASHSCNEDSRLLSPQPQLQGARLVTSHPGFNPHSWVPPLLTRVEVDLA